jgi:hypothetical protein
MIKDGLPDCGEARLWRRSCDSFFPYRLSETTGLQKGICDHLHEGMAMETCLGTTFKIVEAKLFLELLRCLLADPARLDGAGELLDWCTGDRFEK